MNQAINWCIMHQTIENKAEWIPAASIVRFKQISDTQTEIILNGGATVISNTPAYKIESRLNAFFDQFKPRIS